MACLQMHGTHSSPQTLSLLGTHIFRHVFHQHTHNGSCCTAFSAQNTEKMTARIVAVAKRATKATSLLLRSRNDEEPNWHFHSHRRCHFLSDICVRMRMHTYMHIEISLVSIVYALLALLLLLRALVPQEEEEGRGREEGEGRREERGGRSKEGGGRC